MIHSACGLSHLLKEIKYTEGQVWFLVHCSAEWTAAVWWWLWFSTFSGLPWLSSTWVKVWPDLDALYWIHEWKSKWRNDHIYRTCPFHSTFSAQYKWTLCPFQAFPEGIHLVEPRTRRMSQNRANSRLCGSQGDQLSLLHPLAPKHPPTAKESLDQWGSQEWAD